MSEIDDLTEDQKKRLTSFEPNKPCIIKPEEIAGLEEYHEKGRFVFKRPTVSDRLKIGIKEAKYKENLELEAGYSNLAHILATFSVVCSETPKEFSFDNLYEFDPLFTLYDRYNEWLSFFRLSVQLRQETLSGAGK